MPLDVSKIGPISLFKNYFQIKTKRMLLNANADASNSGVNFTSIFTSSLWQKIQAQTVSSGNNSGNVYE